MTGAGGFIGAHLCRVLLERGHTVVALVRAPRAGWQGLGGHAQMQVEVGDVLDQGRLAALCVQREVEAVCHLAVQPPEEQDRARQVNTQGTLSVLQACGEAGVKRMVFTSSMSVYDFRAPAYLPVDEAHLLDPQQVYGAEKQTAEEYCSTQAAGMEVPILRLAGVYGPGKCQGAVYQFIRAALEGQPIQIPLNRAVDLLYVEDAAWAVAVAAEGRGGSQLFNIGSGRAVALREVAELACRQVGASAPIFCGPEGNAFYLDIGRARAQLGFSPRPLSEGMARFIPWVEQEG